MMQICLDICKRPEQKVDCGIYSSRFESTKTSYHCAHCTCFGLLFIFTDRSERTPFADALKILAIPLKVNGYTHRGSNSAISIF